MRSDRASISKGAKPGKNPPRVFLSYSHDSEEHLERVLALANRLRADGVDAWLDQYESAPREGWPLWMERQIERADIVLCVCTETYRRRFESKEEPGKGLGVGWEGPLVRTQLYLDRAKNSQFVPVLFDSADAEHIPKLLAAYSHFRRIADDGYDDLYRLLTGQPETKAPPLGPLRRLDPQPRQSAFGHSLTSDPAADDDPLAGYRSWAREKYAHLDLIGIDAGDVQVQFEEVYVPLRVASRQSLGGKDLGVFGGGRRLDGDVQREEAMEIEGVLRRPEPRHALIVGELGSGKTTALLKLHQRCWNSATSLGLDEGVVPVFLRLRHLDNELLDEGLAAFLEHEVYQLSGGRQQGIGHRLWRYGRLLLLFDGLDEIADAKHREEVLRRIGWYLGQDDAESMRAVVSCRRVGLPSRDADRGGQFETYEVRPFDDEQISELVHVWFREVARQKKITQAAAEHRVKTILDALGDHSKSSQQILEMASNPLLLTLLCVVVLLGNEIPKKRVRFYEQCLDVLLDRWPRQRGKQAPVDLSTIKEALGQLAFLLHSAQRRDDLAWTEVVASFKSILDERATAAQLFRWLLGDVGLLVEYAETTYGFMHLGIQEHLVALHWIAHPESMEVLEGVLDESWWREVFLQVSALSEQGAFPKLMDRLLHHTEVLERRADLLRDCLAETKRPDLTPFVEVLTEGGARSEAVLRLLSTTRFRPSRLMEVLEELVASPEPRLRELARQLLRDSATPTHDQRIALLVAPGSDLEMSEQLARSLTGWQGGCLAEVVPWTDPRHEATLESSKALIAVLGPEDKDWAHADPLREIYDDKEWLVVTLPGERRPTIPDALADCVVLHWELDQKDALLAEIFENLPGREAAVELVVSKDSAPDGSFGISDSEPEVALPYTDPMTHEIFLPVPGGVFSMGDDALFSAEEEERWLDTPNEWVLGTAKPACEVRVSPFWLAKTPVTNAQYGRFLIARGREFEPAYWRDRRFSGPEQPVLGVPWENAEAYCQWLTESNPDGYRFRLPSEAQWEFAARGPESRRYPWGGEDPSDRLACFALDFQEGKPAAVGCYAEGAGPYGHLDLAGLVWEWCRDAWEPNHSRWVREAPPLDPVGEADQALRPLRGGSWDYDAVVLRSAFRGRVEGGNRVSLIGFRVSCVPPGLSLDP